VLTELSLICVKNSANNYTSLCFRSKTENNCSVLPPKRSVVSVISNVTHWNRDELNTVRYVMSEIRNKRYGIQRIIILSAFIQKYYPLCAVLLPVQDTVRDIIRTVFPARLKVNIAQIGVVAYQFRNRKVKRRPP
jgi:hypothetical protein